MVIKRLDSMDVDIQSSNIVTSQIQARQENISSNIDDLVQSIELHGLFSPIMLIQLDNNNYELIAGQRRLKAFKKLAEKNEKFKKIPAIIYENIMEEWEKKAMSISENLNQEPMSEADKIAAVTTCYNHFGKATITSQKTGIPLHQVYKFVKYERLPPVLKKLKDQGIISLGAALDTARLFEFNGADIGIIPEQEIIDCAIENAKLTAKQKNLVKSGRKEMPKASIKEIIERVKKIQETRMPITVEVTTSTYSRVDAYSKQDTKKKSIPLAAEELIEEGLDSHNV